MGIRKPTADAYRIETTDKGPFHPTALFVCGWGRPDSRSATVDTIFRTFDNVGLGATLRLNGADVQWFYKSTSGNANRLHTPTTAISTGAWRWFFGGVDASGNWVVGIDDEETTGAGVALETTGTQQNPTIGHDYAGSAGHEWLGALSDLQFFDRVPTLDERLDLFHSQGAAPIVAGRFERLRLLDAAPGVDTSTTLPVSVVGRSWATTGTGDAWVHAASPYPTRRRAM